MFNGRINKLPASITELIFGPWFNHSIANLPNKITHITFGSYFNKLVYILDVFRDA